VPAERGVGIADAHAKALDDRTLGWLHGARTSAACAFTMMFILPWR
jgi:hypothetical protein